MGKQNVKFGCVACGHCCRDVICLPTPWDVVQIAKETGKSPHGFLEFVSQDEITGVKKSDPEWLKVDGQRYLMALKRGPKGCHFLDAKMVRCKIYAARPLICRLFPFLLHEKRNGDYSHFTLHERVECPKRQCNKVNTQPLYKLYLQDRDHHQDYEDLVTVFNSRNKKPADPVEFVKLFYEQLDNSETT